ncbi:tetratricopeptide repeat protein [Reinekea thalattae]|uniref:Tetratricopeptide repeat protein n=1 Tax=Reinekea thalattae TaxID=2593301 RepID=A0A5C8Z7M1_9GAMM|nr:tetratricopeptide repeat protein [Reinekea thalattae]TXR53314.1 tetratricopeptide repeat protein [Reinekea thalattae]
MKQKRLWALCLMSVVWLCSCVTTTQGPFEQKKDLEKAEKIYIQLGYGYFENGQLLKAKEKLSEALAINSKSAGAHMGLARVYEQEQEYSLAESHFQKAIQYGGATEAHFQYAVYLYNRARFEDSLAQYNEVLKDTLYERRAQVFYYQAIALTRLQSFDEAITAYQKSLVLNTELAGSYLGLARLYNNDQSTDQAYQSYLGFIELVRARKANQNAASLWLGIPLAYVHGDMDLYASLALQLKSQYPQTDEYSQYLSWQAEL